MASAGVNLADAARDAFITGMNLGLRTGAIVALVGAALALAVLPAKAHRSRRHQAASTRPA